MFALSVAVALLGGLAILFLVASSDWLSQDAPTLHSEVRRLSAFDPKSVTLRTPGPPLLADGDVSDGNVAPALDASLIRSIFNGRKDSAKDALAGMWTMTVQPHRDFAKEAVRRINANGIVGDIVECGVWMGGLTMLMVFENMKTDATRHFWLFDTFDGLPEPDSDKDDKRAKRVYKELKEGKMTKGVKSRMNSGLMLDGKWNYGPIDVVKNNLRYTGYPEENFHLVVGKVEDTLPVTALPEKIAILRLDTDWYSSTMSELEHMYDRLQSGGVLIVDDYCAWAGARTAIDEFFSERLGLDASAISKQSPCLVYWKP